MSWAKISCLEVGRCGYMGVMLLYVMSMLIWLSYYVCRNYVYTYDYPNIYTQCIYIYIYIYIYIHTVCNIVQNVVSIVQFVH